MCLTRRRDYPGDPSAVALARDFVAAFVVATLDPRGWGTADDAALLASELVTMAVESGCAQLDVRADVHEDRLELQVSGYGAGVGPGTGPPAPSPLRARVLDGIAERVEFRREPDGSVVGTGRLACRRSWTTGVRCRTDQRTDPDADPDELAR